MKTEKIRVAIFARCSSEIQDYKRQVKDLTKIANKNGWEVVSVITEKISGAKRNEERAGVQRLLKGIERKQYSKILVDEVSRIGRSTMDTLNLIDKIHKAGISIYLNDLNCETLDPKTGEMSMQTEMMLHMLSLFSKNERRNLRLRIISGQKEAKANGVHIGRKSGTGEPKEIFLQKYPKIVDGLKKGFSVRECVKLFDTSLGTVAKIRSLIKEELLQVA